MPLEDDVRKLQAELASTRIQFEKKIIHSSQNLTGAQKWQMATWVFGIILAISTVTGAVLGFAFNSVAKSTAEETAERISIDRISDRVRKDEIFLNDIRLAVPRIPSGSVVAFATEKCPKDWKLYTPAIGRYIVGAKKGIVVGGTIGNALAPNENRTIRLHSHSTSQFNSQKLTRALEQESSDKAPLETVTYSFLDGKVKDSVGEVGPIAGTNAPYVQLLLCIRQ